jgi:RimJ/RimL family protein N-acetyltransferase
MPTPHPDRPPFLLRPAEPADESVLAVLDRTSWSPAHAVTPPPAPPHPPFFDATHHPSQIVVAEYPGEGQERPGGVTGVVGYVRVVPPTSLASNAHVRQIQGLVVDERVRGRGVGRALVEAACALARAQGARRITLRVLGDNIAARALYESAGFAVEGVLPGEFLVGGRYADDVMMGRSLLP